MEMEELVKKFDEVNKDGGMLRKAFCMLADVNPSKASEFLDCYNGSLVISPNKDLVLKEVESCKENDLSILARKDSIEEGIKKLDVIIDQLSPERKEKKEQDERLNRIEESVGALKDMVELIIKQRTNGNGGVSKEV